MPDRLARVLPAAQYCCCNLTIGAPVQMSINLVRRPNSTTYLLQNQLSKRDVLF
jgi:hypothetical protein